MDQSFSPALFKTVREIELEQKVADLERALYRAEVRQRRGTSTSPRRPSR